MIKKTLNTFALFGAIAILAGCQSTAMLEDADNNFGGKDNDPKASQNESSTCPSSGYRFVNYKSFEKLAGPTVADSNPVTPEYSEVGCHLSQDCTSVKIDSDTLTVNLDNGSQVVCKMGHHINKFIFLQPDRIVVATTHDVRIAPLNLEMTCDQFKTLPAVGGVIDITSSTDTDYTPTVAGSSTIDTSSGLSLGISTVSTASKSISVAPPGSKENVTSAGTTKSEYVYLLTGTNWIGRVKPDKFAGGCIEELFNKSQPAISSFDVRNGELFINGLDEALIVLTSQTESGGQQSIVTQ